MMSLAPVSVHQGRHYYQQDNYYTQGQDVSNSSWYGRGAEELGLTGAVQAQAFESLLAGQDPAGEQVLAGKKITDPEKRRAGIDLTFSAPKSVSLAAFVGGDGRLEEAHHRAVNRAMDFAEERYALTRSGGNQDRRTEVAGNFIVAQFRHDTSRAKDPQLHTHNVIINAVQRSDGQWRSLFNEGLYANSKLIGLVYQNELAKEVQDLGYSITRNTNGTFEIDGYSQEQLRAFSKRREQIEALGARDQYEARELVKINRPAKGAEVSRADLQERWQGEAKELGVKHPRPRQTRSFEREMVDHRELLEAAARHATERDVSFKKEALERFALETNLGRIDLKTLETEVSQARSQGDLIEHRPGRFTTREALAIEERMLELLRAGKGQFEAVVRELPEELRMNAKGLTRGQQEAIEKSLTSPDQFLAWQGVAGAGKTFAMNELRAVAEAHGITVRGFAPSAEAAKVLAAESQIEAQTVARLLAAPETARGGGERELWIVDEAGLLSARDAEKLMQRAAADQARVIFVGDTRQLSGVEAGNPFKLLQAGGIETAHLTESRRQKTAVLREAARTMADGAMREGLALLEKDIVEYRREATRVKHVAADYLALSQEERERTLVLAGTNRERELLTAAVREGLKASGDLESSQTVRALRAKDLTREEVLAAHKIEAGDILVFHREYKSLGITKGSQLEVNRVDPEWRQVHARRQDGEEITFVPSQVPGFQVYESREINVAPGDRVRWTKNQPEFGLRNGQDLRVTAVGDKILLTTAKGQQIEVAADGRHHLDHNYVSTVYSSQGKTSERVLISADNTFGKEAMYVAVTRAKSEVRLYTEDKERMLAIADISRSNASARELVMSQELPVSRSQAVITQELSHERQRGRGRSR